MAVSPRPRAGSSACSSPSQQQQARPSIQRPQRGIQHWLTVDGPSQLQRVMPDRAVVWTSAMGSTRLWSIRIHNWFGSPNSSGSSYLYRNVQRGTRLLVHGSTCALSGAPCPRLGQLDALPPGPFDEPGIDALACVIEVVPRREGDNRRAGRPKAKTGNPQDSSRQPEHPATPAAGAFRAHRRPLRMFALAYCGCHASSLHFIT
jgi:hypothetical protein